MIRRPLVFAVAAALVAGCSRATATASATATHQPADVGRGHIVFTAQCTQCHGASGTEGGIGPSLAGEKRRKDAVAAAAWIKNPEPPMPKLWPGTLSDADVADVTAYVESL